jgi:type I restriction enzyme S subunit
MLIFTEKSEVNNHFIKEHFGKVCRFVPNDRDQRRIAEILSAVDRKLELERRRKDKLERVKKGLMNELLTGRKRVKVTLP